MARIEKKLYYINSRNRIGGTDESFSYEINMKTFEPTHCLVLQANIPKSFFIVQDGENTFTLTEEDVNSVVITVPPGNYSRISFKTAVQSLLNLNSPGAYTYTITTPNSSTGDNGKYTFTCAGHTLETKIIMASDNNLYELFGFDIGSTNTFTSGTLESSNVIKMSKEDSVFIHSDIVADGSILQEVYAVENSDFSNIVFQQFAPEYYIKPLKSNQSNVFTFYLTNEDGDSLNLNGLNWNMTLCLFRKDNTNDILKDYLRLSLMS